MTVGELRRRMMVCDIPDSCEVVIRTGSGREFVGGMYVERNSKAKLTRESYTLELVSTEVASGQDETHDRVVR